MCGLGSSHEQSSYAPRWTSKGQKQRHKSLAALPLRTSAEDRQVWQLLYFHPIKIRVRPWRCPSHDQQYTSRHLPGLSSRLRRQCRPSDQSLKSKTRFEVEKCHLEAKKWVLEATTHSRNQAAARPGRAANSQNYGRNARCPGSVRAHRSFVRILQFRVDPAQ